MHLPMRRIAALGVLISTVLDSISTWQNPSSVIYYLYRGHNNIHLCNCTSYALKFVHSMVKSANTISFPEGPLPKNYLTVDRGHVLTAVASAFIALEVIAFILRGVSRWLKHVSFGWDDALIVPALLFNLLVCILAILAPPLSGAGRHTLAVLQEDFGKIEFMGKNALLMMPISYSLAVGFSKGVILNFFLRIFRIGVTRYITYGIAVIVVLHTTVTIFVCIFQCNPIHLLWTAVVRDNCIDTQAFFAYTSIPNIVTDVIMLLMPLPEIWRLNTTTQLKVGVTVTLLTASIGIISSILRFVGFFTSNIFADPAWESVQLMAYSCAEPGTYFLAACLPTYRPLLRLISNQFHSSLSRVLRSRRRLGSRSGSNENVEVVQHGINDEKEEGAKIAPSRPPRGFDSLILSQISAEHQV